MRITFPYTFSSMMPLHAEAMDGGVLKGTESKIDFLFRSTLASGGISLLTGFTVGASVAWIVGRFFKKETAENPSNPSRQHLLNKKVKVVSCVAVGIFLGVAKAATCHPFSVYASPFVFYFPFATGFILGVEAVGYYERKR